jgi:hypothetical protein
VGTLFQDDGQLSRSRSLSTLKPDPDDFRHRAAECTDLAATCLTSEAQQILLDLAADLEREARKLEQAGSGRPIIGGGRR